MTAAARQKLYRSRQAMGVAVYRVELGERGFQSLIRGGLLNDNAADDVEAVQRALTEAIELFADYEESLRVTALARGQEYNGIRKERR